MDFGLSADQREIQRTARELLAERARPERVREHAEAGRLDEVLWRELCELGWPGIAIAEEYGGQGLGLVELSILCEELGRTLAPVPLLPCVLAGVLIEQAGSPEQRERWLPGLASGETIGALGAVRDGVAELVRRGAGRAGVGARSIRQAPRCASYTREEVTVEPVDSIDPTRPAALVRASADGGGERSTATWPAGSTARSWRSPPSLSVSASVRSR